MTDWLDTSASWPDWIGEAAVAAMAAAVAGLVALMLHHALFRVLKRVAFNNETPTDDMLVSRIKLPSRYAMLALAFILAAREIPALADVWQKVAGFAMPALVGWMALAILHALVAAAAGQPGAMAEEDAALRRRRTRLTIFSRIASFIIIFVTVGLMLLSIPGVRDVGMTLMASAGLAGLAVGAAAQPALKSLIASFQMALTEPVSINDIVVIEGHTGRIKDIRTTHVLVELDDGSTLVVPTSKFLEQSFLKLPDRQ